MRKLILFFSSLLILFSIYFYNRSFYCLDNKKCITVWKTFNNKCYLIPGKYYSPFFPSDNFILTTNSSYVGIIWPNTNGELIAEVDEQAKILNSSKDKIKILNYADRQKYYDSIYTYFDGTYKRYNKGVIYMTIDTHDNYATDSAGKKL